MSVRIIAGSAKGRRLTVPSVGGLRPTSDRARETLFNVLAPRLPGARFLDLFAGAGAVGIEALSRGAVAAVFVERERRAVVALEANIELCGFEASAVVVRGSWEEAIPRVGADEKAFEIIFLDPPYDWNDAHACLELVLACALVADDGIAVAEHHGKRPPQAASGWRELRRIDVGDTSFSIFAS